jgi:hypothetical protein
VQIKNAKDTPSAMPKIVSFSREMTICESISKINFLAVVPTNAPTTAPTKVVSAKITALFLLLH